MARYTNYYGDYKSKVTSAFDYAVNQAITSGVTYSQTTIKKHFGREFSLQYENNSGVIKEVTQKFLKKYDKKFDDRTQKSMGDTPALVNTQFILFLEKGTFCYVATGNKIGDTEERFLMSSNISTMDLYIYIFGKKMHKYANELDSIIQFYIKNDELGLFNVSAESSGRYGGMEDSSESLEIIYSNLATRSLDTMFFSHGEKDAITRHIQKFLDNEEFYKEKQILFKTGILLYGRPGTGKSSLVKALATTYNRSIVNINVGKLVNIDLNKLTSSINVDDTRRYIILLEDIDTLYLNRKDSEKKGDEGDENAPKMDKEDSIVTNKLLQFLDSNSSPTNVIFIATTNHKERLDEALLREGRFDLQIDCMNLDRESALEFGDSFRLEREIMEEILNEIDKEFDEKNSERIAAGGKGKKHPGYNQSKLQARILSRLTNKSLDHVESTICVDTDVTGSDGTEESEEEE